MLAVWRGHRMCPQTFLSALYAEIIISSTILNYVRQWQTNVCQWITQIQMDVSCLSVSLIFTETRLLVIVWLCQIIAKLSVSHTLQIENVQIAKQIIIC